MNHGHSVIFYLLFTLDLAFSSDKILLTSVSGSILVEYTYSDHGLQRTPSNPTSLGSGGSRGVSKVSIETPF